MPCTPVHIRIYATGGTIDKIYFDRKNDYHIGAPGVIDLLEEAGVTFTYDVVSLIRKDSLDLTDADRQLIRATILADPHQHIVITHGTDTMIATAGALRDIPAKTIVLTGAMQPARFKSSDAEFNIGFAAAAVQLLPPGVYLAMNGHVFTPEQVRKNVEKNRFEEAPSQ
ncbi:MAG: asparaginase domain-containing protein [bacterium]|nr:asparaginase domain-containing protein [bacterium]